MELNQYKQRIEDNRKEQRELCVKLFLEMMVQKKINLMEIEKITVVKENNSVTMKVLSCASGEREIELNKLEKSVIIEMMEEDKDLIESIGAKVNYYEKDEIKKGIVFNKTVKTSVWEIDCTNIK